MGFSFLNLTPQNSLPSSFGLFHPNTFFLLPRIRFLPCVLPNPKIVFPILRLILYFFPLYKSYSKSFSHSYILPSTLYSQNSFSLPLPSTLPALKIIFSHSYFSPLYTPHFSPFYSSLPSILLLPIPLSPPPSSPLSSLFLFLLLPHLLYTVLYTPHISTLHSSYLYFILLLSLIYTPPISPLHSSYLSLNTPPISPLQSPR